MLSEKETVRASKFLSLVLRHQPQLIGLSLDEGGWAAVDDLLVKLNEKGFHLHREALHYLVDTNSKKRFAFNDDGTKIRASQGHSIAVALGYERKSPPPVLYHGTAEKNIASILKDGLKKNNRQYVHLSADTETAIQVGQRHGRPVLLNVMALEMSGDGFDFFLSANGVWLTDHVPAVYLRMHKG